MNKPVQRVLESVVNTLSKFDVVMLKLAVIAIFVMFGSIKWFEFEVQILKEMLSGTWLEWLYPLMGAHGVSYLIGTIETTVFVFLIIGFFRPCFGVLGALMVIATAMVTLSLLPQLPKPDTFIIKDILLIGAGLVLMRHDLSRMVKKRHPADG